MVHPVFLAFAVSIALDPAACRQSHKGAAATWSADGRGGISTSTAAGTKGEVTLRCRVPVPEGVSAVTLELDRAHISFQPAGSREGGSGLLLMIGRACGAELIRVAGEDWIETPRRAWTAAVPAGSRAVEVTITARDSSNADPLRIDLQGLRLTGGKAQDAQVCQPVQDELNGDRRQHKAH